MRLNVEGARGICECLQLLPLLSKQRRDDFCFLRLEFLGLVVFLVTTGLVYTDLTIADCSHTDLTIADCYHTDLTIADCSHAH